ncbi:MAG TPA: hypothetical protein VEI97_15470 [bacterium]|nr:hypothetical protein [bacterium]
MPYADHHSPHETPLARRQREYAHAQDVAGLTEDIRAGEWERNRQNDLLDPYDRYGDLPGERHGRYPYWVRLLPRHRWLGWAIIIGFAIYWYCR